MDSTNGRRTRSEAPFERVSPLPLASRCVLLPSNFSGVGSAGSQGTYSMAPVWDPRDVRRKPQSQTSFQGMRVNSLVSFVAIPHCALHAQSQRTAPPPLHTSTEYSLAPGHSIMLVRFRLVSLTAPQGHIHSLIAAQATARSARHGPCEMSGVTRPPPWPCPCSTETAKKDCAAA